ncbi:MAG: hypothetical protein B6I25_01080 [Planctomycetales bacterium 4572_13]|nr:MAG: hypothetical protein B6I25_01080 [Planctomycetales bacterium 4572_13]
MKRNFCFSAGLLLCLAAATSCFADTVDLTEKMKPSLVYLEVSTSSYDLSQPWKQTPIAKNGGYGCAVGPYEILTTAEVVADATLIQVMRYGKNARLGATVKAVDYECNLCLLTLDKDAADTPLIPLSFEKLYPKGKQLTTYWLSSGNHLTTARSTLDRAQMKRSFVSFVNNLTFFVTNVSRPFGDGQICCYGENVIGIAGWGTDSESGIIPSETISRFLTYCNKKSYVGFATAGFVASTLLDPARRKYLNIPDNIEYGIYVSDVFTIGTGSSELKTGDVILSIKGQKLNAYGRYEHPEYKRISFHHILSQTPNGDIIPFEIVRDGKITTLDITARSIKSDNMLVPYYTYGKQPEFMVVGGYIFQKLNRDYLTMWGSNSGDKAPPHFYHYKRDFAFKPSKERRDIVILSFVFPAEINLGYQKISQLVVDSVNDTKVTSMKNFVNLVNETENESIKITFEMDSPTLIIPKYELALANMQIAKSYGVTKMVHLDE